MQDHVTVFGGSGFIGRHLVRRLIERGTAVRVVARNVHGGLFDTGSSRPQWLAGSITDATTRSRAVEDTGAVVNLIGTTAAPDAETFFELHSVAPRELAAEARRAGVTRFVQISAMGVAEDAPALADRSKAAGEQAVRDAFPEATIVRPALVYGADDHFLTRFSAMVRGAPAVPLIGGGRTRFQPIHVADAADTLVNVLSTDEATGRTYGLAAGEVLTFRELIERLCAAIGRRPRLLTVPFPVARAVAALAQLLPRPPITVDQVRLLETDKLMTPEERTPQSVGVAPRTLAEFLISPEARLLLEG
jgi:NADH dehydrogenase